MVKEELIAGLKNGLARGGSLREVAQSFISAGYDFVDVQEAARYVYAGAIHNVPSAPGSNQQIPQQPSPNQQTSQNRQITQDPKTPPVQQTPQIQEQKTTKYQPLPKVPTQEKPKRRLSPGLITLIAVLSVLILALVGFAIFGPKLLDIMFPQGSA